MAAVRFLLSYFTNQTIMETPVLLILYPLYFPIPQLVISDSLTCDQSTF